MLETRERSLLLETLRPPVGYAIDRAVGTSFTLDLMALLAAPLAFTFFNYNDDEGQPTSDPVALLEALRRHAEKITIFCQAGAIKVPKPEQTLLTFLEKSVVEVKAPKKEGIFHPKVWLLRFVADGRPVRYRFLSLSRNLTFDRAWDTCLALDGEVVKRRRGFAVNRPLGEFVEALPGMAVRKMPSSAVESVQAMADEVRRVKFAPPYPFQKLSFIPMGHQRGVVWPFKASTRMLVVSPFLTPWAVERLTAKSNLSVLVSRPESLEEIPEELLPEGETYVLSPGAAMDSREVAEEDELSADPVLAEQRTELSGLHAKLYVAEVGHHAHVFTGSANATRPAFESNVEFLVKLIGGWKHCGIPGLMGESEDQREDTLGSLLQPYTPRQVDSDPVEEAQRKFEASLERFARRIAGRRFTARVHAQADHDLYDLALVGQIPSLPPSIRLSSRPVTLQPVAGQPITLQKGTLCQVRGLSFEALSSFWAFELVGREKKLVASVSFVVNVTLEGAPEDRRERLLKSLLKNSTQVMRLLLLLLSDEEFDVSKLVKAASGAPTPGKRWGTSWTEPTLLEALLRSLSTDPKRLDHAAKLIDDLRRTPEGAALLPDELEAIWEPIWKVRSELAK